VQGGEIQLAFSPNPQGRKMRVEVVREGGWPQEDLPQPRKRRKNSRRSVFFSYRWGVQTDQRIAEVAGEAVKGEVVTLLLETALERLKAGKWGLKPRAVTVKQGVSVNAGEWKGSDLAKFRA